MVLGLLERAEWVRDHLLVNSMKENTLFLFISTVKFEEENFYNKSENYYTEIDVKA